MAKTREYMDYLDDNIGIAPAYSEEEYQASETIAGIMREHDVETSVEEFDGRASSDLVRNALVIVMFVTLLLAGILSDALHVIFLLVSIVASGLLVFNHFVRDLFEELGSTRRSQNVVAVRRARAEEVVRGSRPIVIVAHYDTPRESVMRRGSLAHYLPLLTRVAAICPAVVAVTLLFQIMLFLPDAARMFMWIVGLVASVPALFVAIGSIVSGYGNCTLGSNDNKSSVAALLAMVDKVSPAEDRVTAKAAAKPTRPRRRLTDAEPVVAPRTREVVEEVHGVRHGEDVLRGLGILPETCEITYEEPRVTVIEESPVQDDDMDASPEKNDNEFVDGAYDDDFENEFDEEYDDSYDEDGLRDEDEEYVDEGETSSPGILSRLRGLPSLHREDEPTDEEEYAAEDDEQYFEDDYYDDETDDYAPDEYESDDEAAVEDESYSDVADGAEEPAAEEDYEDENLEDEYEDENLEDYDDYVYEDEEFDSEDERMGSSIGAWFSERISAIRARFASGEKDDDGWIDEDESQDEEEYFDEDESEDLVEEDEGELTDEEEFVDDGFYEDEDDTAQADEVSDDDSLSPEAEDYDADDYEDEYLEDEGAEEEYPEDEELVDEDEYPEDEEYLEDEEEYVDDEELLDEGEYLEDEEEYVDGPDDDLDAYDEEEEYFLENHTQIEEEVTDDPDALADLAFDAELEENYASDFEYDDEYDTAYAEESYLQPYVDKVDTAPTYEDQAYEEPAYEEMNSEEHAWEEEDSETDTFETDQDYEEQYDEDVLEDDDALYDEYEDDDLYDSYDEVEEEEREARPTTSGQSIVSRFLGLFRKGGRGTSEQNAEGDVHDTYGDEYGQDEYYLEEGESAYDEYGELIEEEPVAQVPVDDGYGASYGQEPLGDTYEDEYGEEYEHEYLEDYDDETYPEDLPAAPLPDPNMLHFDREEDDDIVARDDSGLNTISDSYDLYARDVDRESRRTKPAAIEDPTWGTSTYQPARPAMNIARRAALYDLPDPSGATVDPLADDYGYEEDVRETRGGFWNDGANNAQADAWKGGAAIRDDLRDEETSMFDGELQDAMLELGDGFLDEHDIWFVATGASGAGHSGIKAFLDAHRRDIRGAFLINLECVGAGDLAVYGREGIRNNKKADRRLVRMVLDVARDLHIGVDTANCDWNETDAASAMRARVRSVSIVGLDPDNLPALSQTADDVPENVNPDQVDDVVRIVTEVIRRA